jgi:S1-C subfamily serine protease
LSDVGFTVTDRDPKGEPIRDGVGLKEVCEGTPFAIGLRVGDVVMALNGTKTTSPEALRRLLRPKLAQGSSILTFTVRRSSKTLDVPIPIKD